MRQFSRREALPSNRFKEKGIDNETKKITVNTLIENFTDNQPEIREKLLKNASEHMDETFDVIFEFTKIFEKSQTIPSYYNQVSIMMDQETFKPQMNFSDVMIDINKALESGGNLNISKNLLHLSEIYPDIYGLTFKNKSESTRLPFEYKVFLSIARDFSVDRSKYTENLIERINKIIDRHKLEKYSEFIRHTVINGEELKALLFLGAMYNDEELHELIYTQCQKHYESTEELLQNIDNDPNEEFKGKIDEKAQWEKLQEEAIESKLRSQRELEIERRNRIKPTPEFLATVALTNFTGQWMENNKNLNSFYRKKMIEKASIIFNKHETSIQEGNPSITISDEIMNLLQSHNALSDVLDNYPKSALELFLVYGKRVLNDTNNDSQSLTFVEDKAIIKSIYRSTKNIENTIDSNSDYFSLVKELKEIEILKSDQKKIQTTPKVKTIITKPVSKPIKIKSTENRTQRRIKRLEEEKREEKAIKRKSQKEEDFLIKPEREKRKTATQSLRGEFNLKERENLLCSMLKDFFSNEMEGLWDEKFENSIIKSIESARETKMNGRVFPIDLREAKPKSPGFGDRIIFLIYKGKILAAERIDHKILDNGARISEKVKAYQRFLKDHIDAIAASKQD